ALIAFLCCVLKIQKLFSNIQFQQKLGHHWLTSLVRLVHMKGLLLSMYQMEHNALMLAGVFLLWLVIM
ncbi:hypothetical protein KJ996_06320, partial [Patescibacteria group bacterium]|nr:hypothetical protein [Patescibacteria group bacterium]